MPVRSGRIPAMETEKRLRLTPVSKVIKYTEFFLWMAIPVTYQEQSCKVPCNRNGKCLGVFLDQITRGSRER